MAVYGHTVRDFNNFSMTYHRHQFYMVARNISGNYCLLHVNQKGQFIRPFYYIDGRMPVASEQNSKVSIINGAIGDDIVINHYPFVPITKGFMDAREGAVLGNYSSSDFLIKGQPVTARDSQGGSVSDTNLDNWSDKRDGVQVANGKPSIIVTNGVTIVLYAYSDKFSAGQITASCPPFIGRIYAIASTDGINWTPPACVLNLSLFNPPSDVYSMRFDKMLDYFDTASNIFSSSSDAGFYKDTAGLRSAAKLTDAEIANISCQDFSATHDNTTNTDILTFWFGGFICYRDISYELNLVKSWAGQLNRGSISLGSQFEPYKSPVFSSIYDAVSSNGEYTYTKAFWMTGGSQEIFIAAGPVDRIISNSVSASPVPKPGEESIAATILKAVGGSGSRNSLINVNTTSTTQSLIQDKYDPTWKGVFPPRIVVKFDNTEYSGVQLKQAPAIGVGSVGKTMVAFYSSSNNIAYIPVIDYNRVIVSGYPKILV